MKSDPLYARTLESLDDYRKALREEYSAYDALLDQDRRAMLGEHPTAEEIITARARFLSARNRSTSARSQWDADTILLSMLIEENP